VIAQIAHKAKSAGTTQTSTETSQWRSQDLVVVGALEKWDMARGVPPHGERVWRGSCAPFLENFWILG